MNPIGKNEKKASEAMLYDGGFDASDNPVSKGVAFDASTGKVYDSFNAADELAYNHNIDPKNLRLLQ